MPKNCSNCTNKQQTIYEMRAQMKLLKTELEDSCQRRKDLQDRFDHAKQEYSERLTKNLSENLKEIDLVAVPGADYSYRLFLINLWLHEAESPTERSRWLSEARKECESRAKVEKSSKPDKARAYSSAKLPEMELPEEMEVEDE